jgi:hypothetical protein
MKRDMNLIRLLLLNAEGEEPKPDLSAFTEEQTMYHSRLLIEAQLVHGRIITDRWQRPTGRSQILRLTWSGHEFLDTARNNTIWKKAGERIKKAGLVVPLTLIQEILNQLVRERLKLP